MFWNMRISDFDWNLKFRNKNFETTASSPPHPAITSTLCITKPDPSRFEHLSYFIFDLANHIAHSDSHAWEKRWKFKHGNSAC